MNSPDDKALDEYLQRDSAVSQQYRTLDADDVPPALDSAVMAQAREAVIKKSNPRPKWSRWSAPIALAASLVLGIAVVLEIGVDERVTLPSATESQEAAVASDAANENAIEAATQQPPSSLAEEMQRLDQAPTSPSSAAPPPAAPQPFQQRASDTQVSAKERKRAVAVEEAPTPTELLARDAAGPVAETPAEPLRTPVQSEQAVTAAASAENSTAAQDLRRETEERTPAQGAFAQTRAERAPAERAPAPTSVRQTAAIGDVANRPQEAAAPRLEPGLWLDQIRALRRDGKVLEADEQWRQFVATYPDVEVARTDAARPKP